MRGRKSGGGGLLAAPPGAQATCNRGLTKYKQQEPKQGWTMMTVVRRKRLLPAGCTQGRGFGSACDSVRALNMDWSGASTHGHAATCATPSPTW
jgi:hypothetical protein